MAQTFNEVWMHLGQRTWKVYENVNDDLRLELCRNGWTLVHRNESVEDVIEQEVVKKHLKKKKDI